MEFKKLMTIFFVTVTIIFALILMLSYGYYVASSKEATKFNVNTSDSVAVVYSQGQNISTSIGQPILTSEISTKASKSIFTVTVPTTLSGHKLALQINLTNISIDDALKDSHFKWQLLLNGSEIRSGSFVNLTGNTLELYPLTTQSINTYPATYNYELRIYLEEICTDLTDITTCSDYSAWQTAYNNKTETYQYNDPNSNKYGQSRMMGKKINGKIEVISVIK